MVEDDFQELDGTLIGPGGFAVTDEGAVISASKLTVPQMRAELTARGLSTEGKRQDLYRRVQVGHAWLWRAMPMPSHELQYHASAENEEERSSSG